MENMPTPEELRLNAIKQDLTTYGEENKLRGLEGRIQRGLDPAGMLAVKETRIKLEKVAEALGASMEDVIKLTNELHVGAIWNNADKLAKGDDPAVETWMTAAEITTAGKEKEGDLSEQEFIKDLERVQELLDEAMANPEEFALRAKKSLVDSSKEQFSISEDGVPVSELDSGFLAMAINGYKAGIVKDKDWNLFVGANELDYNVLESMGLKAVEKERRGRMATIYVDDKGNNVVVKLYPGLALLEKGEASPASVKIAKELVRTGEVKSKEMAQ
jgi:hypothetical protein